MVENPATIDDIHLLEFGIFTKNLLVVIWRSLRCPRENTLRCSTRFGYLSFAWSDNVWHYDWAFVFLLNGRVKDLFASSCNSNGLSLLLN